MHCLRDCSLYTHTHTDVGYTVVWQRSIHSLFLAQVPVRFWMTGFFLGLFSFPCAWSSLILAAMYKAKALIHRVCMCACIRKLHSNTSTHSECFIVRLCKECFLHSHDAGPVLYFGVDCAQHFSTAYTLTLSCSDRSSTMGPKWEDVCVCVLLPSSLHHQVVLFDTSFLQTSGAFLYWGGGLSKRSGIYWWLFCFIF